MEMTKTDAVFKHRVLWCTLAEYMSKGIVEDTIAGLKYKVLKERFPTYAENLVCNCFLCTYANGCISCPLQDITQSDCLGGLYRNFDFVYHMEGRKLAVETALKIAFLPVIN